MVEISHFRWDEIFCSNRQIGALNRKEQISHSSYLPPQVTLVYLSFSLVKLERKGKEKSLNKLWLTLLLIFLQSHIASLSPQNPPRLTVSSLCLWILGYIYEISKTWSYGLFKALHYLPFPFKGIQVSSLQCFLHYYSFIWCMMVVSLGILYSLVVLSCTFRLNLFTQIMKL